MSNVAAALETMVFGYDANGLLGSEDGPWANDTVSYGYNTGRQRNSLTLQHPNASSWVQSYLYDNIRRLTNVVSPAGTFGYEYTSVGQSVSPASLIKKLTLPGGSYITNTFDSVARLLSTSLKNSGGTVLNSHAYVYDLDGERTKQTFKDGNYLDYTYDALGQLKTALGKESGGSVARLHEQFKYGYDYARNLNFPTNNALNQTFGLNNLNQLTNVTRSGTLTVAGTTTSAATNVTVNAFTADRYADNTFARTNFSLTDGNNTFTAIAQDNLGRMDTNAVTVNLPATPSFQYDIKGDLSSDGRRALEYDDENQLIRITVTNSWKTEFTYDGLFRRRIRKEFTWQNGTFVPSNEVRYIYDGRLVIQERDGNDLPLVSYTRGSDLSGSFQGAAGIGGLLARTDHLTINPTHAFYHADGNGNIAALVNDRQLVVARYEYDSFGNILAKSGPLADGNNYRFSSQEYHQPSGLLLYLYRPYDANLQRFVNRDPIEELGGMNVYGFVGNNPIGRVDLWGLDDEDPDDPTSDENLAKGNNGAMQLKAKDCHEAAKNGLRVGKAVLEGGANACMMLCPVGGAAGGLRGARSAEVVAADVAKLKKVKECVKAKQEIKAALDATGKVHKALPKPKDFSKYHPEDLRKLMQDLKQSVQERIRVTARLGSNPGHDARQAEEQQLIKFIEKYLDDIKFPAN